MEEEEIAQLLSKGAQPAELVHQGYCRGPVYKVKRRLDREGTPQRSGGSGSIDLSAFKNPWTTLSPGPSREAQDGAHYLCPALTPAAGKEILYGSYALRPQEFTKVG